MNYTTLTSSIQTWTENTETNFVAEIPQFVKNAEDRIYQSVVFDALRKHATGSLTANSRELALPADFIAPYSFFVIYSSETRFLLPKDESFLLAYQTTAATTGVPKYYALKDESTIRFSPAAATTYSYDLNYFYKPESIVTAGTTWLGTNFENLLLYACLVEAYTYMKGEADLLGKYDARFMEQLDRLKKLGGVKQLTDAYRIGEIPRASL